MPSSAGKRPTPAELEILQIFWRLGRARVATVHEAIQQRRPLSINTVSTMVGVLVDKGFLRKVRDDRPQEFEAAIEESQLQRSYVADVRERLFSGSLRQLINHAFRGREPSKEELAELQRLIDDAKRKDG